MAIQLKDISLFKGLAPADLTAIKACLKEKSFDKGESLFLQGTECTRIFFVKTGRVKLFRIGPSGREQTLQTIEEGDTCSCNPGTTEWMCAATAQALTPATVWFLSTADYARLVKNNPDLARALNRLFAERIQCLNSLVEEVSLKDSRKRLIKFLMDLAKPDSGPAATIPLPFTREEMAQRIGTTRETVERQLSQLKNRGLIELGRRQVVLKNREALQKILDASH